MNLCEMSPHVLAYLGDAVFELRVRSMVVQSPGTVHDLRQKAEGFVSAKNQSRMYFKLDEFLDDDEKSVLRRGRNSKPSSWARSASMSDYKHATGLEALFGYLYLKGDTKRLDEIFEICVAANEQQGEA
ncbi:MAG: ribonuclease III [Clostridiales bacterium]|nr:ribonuclease III [Clostridiales bacterium]MDR2752324.1 ribonuclease III [Clostridiales bacterium]